MNKQNIKHYSDDELSLLIFNTEELYKIRYNNGFFDIIEDLYEFTPEQFSVLVNDLLEEIEV